jgi:protein tyrosine/serine phosphatase
MYNALLIVLVIIGVLLAASHKSREQKIQELESIGDFRQIEGTNNSYRSSQLSLAEMDILFRDYDIRTIIRLNGNGKDAAGVSIEEEAALAKKYHIQFYHINAHEGYQSGKGYLGSNQAIADMLDQDHVYIHCRHGFDRTGSVVAFFMRTQGYDQYQVIHHNKWEAYLNKKGQAYRKYYEAAIADYSMEDIYN